MANLPEPKQINTLAELLADLAGFKGNPATTPVKWWDGAQAWPLATLSISHGSAPPEIWIEQRFNKEFAVARLRANLQESEDHIAALVAKSDRLKSRLKLAIQARDQYKTLMDMGGYK